MILVFMHTNDVGVGTLSIGEVFDLVIGDSVILYFIA